MRGLHIRQAASTGKYFYIFKDTCDSLNWSTLVQNASAKAKNILLTFFLEQLINLWASFNISRDFCITYLWQSTKIIGWRGL